MTVFCLSDCVCFCLFKRAAGRESETQGVPRRTGPPGSSAERRHGTPLLPGGDSERERGGGECTATRGAHLRRQENNRGRNRRKRKKQSTTTGLKGERARVGVCGASRVAVLCVGGPRHYRQKGRRTGARSPSGRSASVFGFGASVALLPLLWRTCAAHAAAAAAWHLGATKRNMLCVCVCVLGKRGGAEWAEGERGWWW